MRHQHRNEQLAIARARGAELRQARRAKAPPCNSCGKPLQQNQVEREDGVWWCPACGRYTDGSCGFPVGHPGRADRSTVAIKAGGSIPGGMITSLPPSDASPAEIVPSAQADLKSEVVGENRDVIAVQLGEHVAVIRPKAP